jgi:hypothetical protein
VWNTADCEDNFEAVGKSAEEEEEEEDEEDGGGREDDDDHSGIQKVIDQFERDREVCVCVID